MIEKIRNDLDSLNLNVDECLLILIAIELGLNVDYRDRFDYESFNDLHENDLIDIRTHNGILEVYSNVSILGEIKNEKEIKLIPSVSDNLLKEYRILFKEAVGRREGSKSITKKKLERLFSETDITETELLEATRAYLNDCRESSRFIRYPEYFLFKVQNNGIEKYEDSLVQDWLDVIRSNEVIEVNNNFDIV